MVRQSVLHYIQKCPKCGCTFIEEIGETCRCPNLMMDMTKEEQEEFAAWANAQSEKNNELP